MADINRLKCQDIPFLNDGVAKIVKSVNKQTTCNDVINKLPNMQCPLAVFESVNGIEKELAGKKKILKAWRSHGPSDRVVFVVKKSEHTVLKRSRSGLLTEIKAQRINSNRMASNRLRKVRYQKTKVQNTKRKFDEERNTDEDRVKKVIQFFASSSSMDSMDAFLTKTDLENMASVMSFCGGVTEEHPRLPRTSMSSRDQQVHCEYETKEEMNQVSNGSIKTSINNMKHMKLGFKQKFLSRSKAAKRTTSAGTISSTDSGYNSVTSKCQDNQVTEHQELEKCPIFMDSNLGDAPRHSTPMIARSFGKVECDTEENDPFDLSFYDESEGKDAIMKKFITDQQKMTKEIDNRASIGCYGFLPEIEDHGRPSRFSLPVFRSQKEKCRYLWEKNCGDTSSVANDSAVWNASQLDNAFIDSFEEISNTDFVTPRNRTLRRESAMSNLNRFSLQVMPVDTEDDYNSFNYSFDCTFPRMDESQSMDVSGCFRQGFDHVNATRELLRDMCDDSVVESDEGLGSMQSGSVQYIAGIYV